MNVLPIVASLALYVAACFLPALRFESHEPVRGITTLLLGWWGILSYDFPWLANVAYVIALSKLAIGKQSDALKYIVAAIIIGLLTVFVKRWFFNEAEATPVKSLGPAFFLWIGSFVVLLSAYVLPKA